MEPLSEPNNIVWSLPFTPQDWAQTPLAVQAYIHSLHDEPSQLHTRLETLEARLTQNSTTSSRPPSSDSPYKKPRRHTTSTGPRKAGGKPGHRGHRQVLLAPTSVQELRPAQCACGHPTFALTTPYYTHQVIELPPIAMEALAELQRLCHMATAPPTGGEWRAWYARLCRLIEQYHDRSDDAGRFARRLLREMDALWVFLAQHGVDPTNNRAERALRFGVLWRKRSLGTASAKGNRWVERILSLKETCRLRAVSTYNVLLEAVTSLFTGQQPSLTWLHEH
jgi:transposase